MSFMNAHTFMLNRHITTFLVMYKIAVNTFNSLLDIRVRWFLQPCIDLDSSYRSYYQQWRVNNSRGKLYHRLCLSVDQNLHYELCSLYTLVTLLPLS